eukprot:g54825.t1
MGKLAKKLKAVGPWFLSRVLLTPVFAAVFLGLDQLYHFTDGAPQWQVLFWYCLLKLSILCEYAHTSAQYFSGEGPTYWERLTAWYKQRRNKREEDELFEEDDLFDEPGADRRNGQVSNGRSLSRIAPSFFVIWLFGKTLGDACRAAYQADDLLGALGYTGWCASLLTVAIIAYHLRTGPYHFESLPSALHACYGALACLLFLGFLLFRLFNDVWTNTVVAASFFGPGLSRTGSGLGPDSPQAWWGALGAMLSVGALAAAVGGLRASFVSAKLEAALLVGALVVMLVFLYTSEELPTPSLKAEVSQWSLDSGGDLWAVTLLQGMLSYGLHDPILADRAWAGQPRAVLWGAIGSAILVAVFTALFSGYLGALGRQTGLGGEVAEIAAGLGELIYVCSSLVVVVASLASIQAALLAAGKVVALELGGFSKYFRSDMYGRAPLTARSRLISSRHLRLARLSVFVLALAGMVAFLVWGPEDAASLNESRAPLVLGTAATGLGAPVALLLVWRNEWHVACLAFHLPCLAGVLFGVLLFACPEGASSTGPCSNALGAVPSVLLRVGHGPHAFELALNLWAQVVCVFCCMLGLSVEQLLVQRGKGPQSIDSLVYMNQAQSLASSHQSSSSKAAVHPAPSQPLPASSSQPPHSRLMMIAVASSLSLFSLLCVLAAAAFGSAGVATLICIWLAMLCVAVVLTVAHAYAYKHKAEQGNITGLEMMPGVGITPTVPTVPFTNTAVAEPSQNGGAVAITGTGAHLTVNSGSSYDRLRSQAAKSSVDVLSGSVRVNDGWQEAADDQVEAGEALVQEALDRHDDLTMQGVGDLDVSMEEFAASAQNASSFDIHGLPGSPGRQESKIALTSFSNRELFPASGSVSRATSRIKFEVEEPTTQTTSTGTQSAILRMVSGEITY